MANTQYTDIYDLFMMSVKDYNLDTLFSQSESDLSTYLQGFLVICLPDFINSKKDLSNRNDSSGTFNFELSDKEKTIICDLMVRRWFIKEIQSITQFQNLLNDTDFKVYSNANNLKSKQEYLSVLNEQIKQELAEYGMQNINWAAWAVGNFNL